MKDSQMVDHVPACHIYTHKEIIQGKCKTRRGTWRYALVWVKKGVAALAEVHNFGGKPTKKKVWERYYPTDEPEGFDSWSKNKKAEWRRKNGEWHHTTPSHGYAYGFADGAIASKKMFDRMVEIEDDHYNHMTWDQYRVGFQRDIFGIMHKRNFDK